MEEAMLVPCTHQMFHNAARLMNRTRLGIAQCDDAAMAVCCLIDAEKRD
jgi:hypothetical protein